MLNFGETVFGMVVCANIVMSGAGIWIYSTQIRASRFELNPSEHNAETFSRSDLTNNGLFYGATLHHFG